MTWLLNFDKIINNGMGGTLSERPDLSGIEAILDLACGPGGWVLEVAREHRAERLRVGRLAQCGRPGDVAEEDGHGLSLLAGGRGGGELGPAVGAAGEPLRRLLAAAWADRHQPRLLPPGSDFNPAAQGARSPEIPQN